MGKYLNTRKYSNPGSNKRYNHLSFFSLDSQRLRLGLPRVMDILESEGSAVFIHSPFLYRLRQDVIAYISQYRSMAKDNQFHIFA